MTIEEATKILQDGEWWDDYSFYRPETSTSDKAKDNLLDAIDIAIAALSAKQDMVNNEKGCKYCRDREVITWDMYNDAVMIDTDGRTPILEGGYWNFKINFCPICGRRLRTTQDGAEY